MNDIVVKCFGKDVEGDEINNGPRCHNKTVSVLFPDRCGVVKNEGSRAGQHGSGFYLCGLKRGRKALPVRYCADAVFFFLLLLLFWLVSVASEANPNNICSVKRYYLRKAYTSVSKCCVG